jgi:phospholipid-translocating ATPase
MSMCLICAILCGVWEHTTGTNFTAYLAWDDTIVPGPPEEKGFKQIVVIALLMFFSYLILLNTVVPISLYVRYIFHFRAIFCAVSSVKPAVG